MRPMTITEESNYHDSQPLPGILVLGQPVTRAELSAAFDLVSDKTNWKNPINKRVKLTPTQIMLVYEAIQFFAGCVPTFRAIDSETVFAGGVPIVEFHVKAVGYYAAVGA